MGYTPYYVAAVWTGYKYNAKISYSGNPAITMWKKVMQQVHADLPNKEFDRPSTGLENVQVCLDSGLKPTEACLADSRRGSRVATVTVAAGTGPKEECGIHAFRDYCTEGQCLATEDCPAESVVQKAFLDYVRADYGPTITASDDPYRIANMEKALEPTEAGPGGCPVHSGMIIEDPDDPTLPENDPNDPNYIPPSPNEGGTVGDPNGGTEGQPVQPTTPTEPAEPSTDPSGGDWWNDLWGTTDH